MSCLKKEFIEKLIKINEKDDSIKINSIFLTPAVGKGENFMSVVSKIFVKGTKNVKNNEVDYSRTLIMKEQFKIKTLQEMFKTDKVFENEVLGYNHIIPALKNGSNLKISVPQCLYADVNLIVLEDLSVDGYTMLKNRNSLTVDECTAILKELATLHAASVIMKKKDLQKFNTLSEKFIEIMTSDNIIIKGFIEQKVSSTIKILQREEKTNEIEKAIEELRKLRETLFPKVCDLIQSKQETHVFNHGDCWMNNILFKNINNHIAVKLVDLQIMRSCSIAADLSYFLYINLSPEDRINNLNYFLESYISYLHNCFNMNSLESETRIYTKLWLTEQMKQFSWFGFMFALWISPVLYINKESIPDMESLTADDMKPENQEKFDLEFIKPEYKARLISLVLNFVNTQA